MSKSIVDQLLAKMKERKVKVPKLALELNIPKDRIYKWFQQGTNPKEEDSIKIRNWINGEKVEVNPFGTMDLAEERALIRVMLDELAFLKSKIQPGVSYEEAKEELRRKTNLVLESMKGA